jgi:PAS domain S-box-containing protein
MLIKRLGIVAGFALLLALLVVNTFVIRFRLGAEVDAESWVNHSRQVLFQLERTESLLKDAETGQRGFLYTGDPKYLEPYSLAVAQIRPDLDGVAQLTIDNPIQQARIPKLRELAEAKLAELAQTIALDRSGRPDKAKALVKSNVGRAAMDSIRSLVAEMEKEETSLEASRAAALEKSTLETIVSIYLLTLLAGLGLAFLAYFILREIKQREDYLHEIRRREQWYRVTLTSIGDAVIATNEHGKVTFLNPVAEKLTGTSLDGAIGKEIGEIFPIFSEITQEAVENPVQKVVEQGQVVALANHTVLKSRNGTVIPIEDSAAPIRDDHDQLVGVVLVFRDVSVERKSRDVLYKTERLAAAARLSASVAHEINNPLEAIVNLIYLAKSAKDVSAPVLQLLVLAEQELERISHITRQTLGFYRDSTMPEKVEIPVLIESVLRLYSNKLRNKNIAIVRDFCQSSPVLGMPGELRQVVSNLISNAVDAVGSDGNITLRTRSINEPQGNGIQVEIEDDGPGVAPEDKNRIFEPFFTTKTDVGTGLGLWVTKEIIERHGGSIHVASRADDAPGAVFTMVLPCDAAAAPAMAPQ